MFDAGELTEIDVLAQESARTNKEKWSISYRRRFKLSNVYNPWASAPAVVAVFGTLAYDMIRAGAADDIQDRSNLIVVFNRSSGAHRQPKLSTQLKTMKNVRETWTSMFDCCTDTRLEVRDSDDITSLDEYYYAESWRVSSSTLTMLDESIEENVRLISLLESLAAKGDEKGEGYPLPRATIVICGPDGCITDNNSWEEFAKRWKGRLDLHLTAMFPKELVTGVGGLFRMRTPKLAFAHMDILLPESSA